MCFRAGYYIRCIVCIAIALGGWSVSCSGATESQGRDSARGRFFEIQVVDEATGRGVPLIELRTTNHISYFTDSQGVIAFYEPGLVGRKVFFHISGHGYEYRKDGFGFRGKRIEVTPGGSARVEVKRVNIAERLYRVTGQGIYGDSVRVGRSVPVAKAVINGLVMGQDSVQTCWFNDRLYWFWGDTNRPSYPLGHFATAGAVSYLREQGGPTPSVGVDLDYFTDSGGFSKKMAPMSEPGMIWLDGVFAVDDSNGNPHMLARYSRMKSLGEASDRGIMDYNTETNQFDVVRSGGPEFLLYSASGHPLGVRRGKSLYYYFATAFPLGVRMRVRASFESAIDPGSYEVFTSLSAPGRGSDDFGDSRFRWVASRELLENWGPGKTALIRALQKEKVRSCVLYDVDTGSAVKPHGGTVYWNRYRDKWVMITVQEGGTSYLGEVWYAESETALGPWCYAKKIVSHDDYSFYNPKQHPYFDEDGGRLIYFEGTYSHTFSGNSANATPRYDYNQIMYRLDLSDRRLFLPEPVYEAGSDSGGLRYLVGDAARSLGEAGREPRVAFYAMAGDRKLDGSAPVYAQETTGDGFSLTTESSGTSAEPVFWGRREADGAEGRDSVLAGLFEYRHKRMRVRLYSIEPMESGGWTRGENPLCYVWKNPAAVSLTDWRAEPWNDWEGK